MSGQPPRLSERTFGVALAILLSAIALVRWLVFGRLAEGLLVTAGALLAAALLVPGVLLPLNRLFESLARRVALVTNYVVLAPFLWLVMTPIGWAMRIAGRDPMRRRFEPETESYLTPVGRVMTAETVRDMF